MSICIFSLIACGSSKKDDTAPKRAIVHNTGGYGMQYKVDLFMPVHDRYGYYYVQIDMYMDDLNKVNGSEILWKNYLGDDLALEEGGENLENVSVTVGTDTVQVKGFRQEGYNDANGKYKIETTSPDSWGIPYDGDGK